jgi:hypothetical protein
MMSLSFGDEKEKRNGGMILMAFINRPTKSFIIYQWEGHWYYISLNLSAGLNDSTIISGGTFKPVKMSYRSICPG